MDGNIIKTDAPEDSLHVTYVRNHIGHEVVHQSKMGDRIKEMRNKLGLTQEELGKKLGVKRAAVNKWETGEVENIKRSTLEEMARIFRCRPSWIMDLDDVPDVTLTYEAPGKKPVKLLVDPESAPIVGQAGLRAQLYKAALNVKPENYQVAIELLESLS